VQNLPVTHDAFFRALMDEPGVAAALLREHLPAEVAGTVETLGVRQPPSDRRRVVSDPDQA
jgi:hypothetical protein